MSKVGRGGGVNVHEVGRLQLHIFILNASCIVHIAFNTFDPLTPSNLPPPPVQKVGLKTPCPPDLPLQIMGMKSTCLTDFTLENSLLLSSIYIILHHHCDNHAL